MQVGIWKAACRLNSGFKTTPKEKVPSPFAWLETFFIPFFPQPLTLLLIGGLV
jgi:hypothetical protein